jgi:hypothetical protein
MSSEPATHRAIQEDIDLPREDQTKCPCCGGSGEDVFYVVLQDPAPDGYSTLECTNEECEQLRFYVPAEIVDSSAS